MRVHEEKVDAWLLAEVTLSGELNKDKQALAAYVKEGEQLLTSLPIKPERDELTNCLAAKITTSCRRVRNAFINQHAYAVYSILTEAFSRYIRLSELVFDAAEKFPGLVPTKRALDKEKQNLQKNKEGLEIDQGLFFRGLFNCPEIGAHLLDAMLLPTSRALSLLGDLQRTDCLNLGVIQLERRGRVAYVTMNNTSCLNAENQRLIDDLETAVDLVLLDERINVVVLRGGVMTHRKYAGKRVFCAGINLYDLHAGKISFVDFLLGREVSYMSKIAHGLLSLSPGHALERTIQKPWIGVIDSFAIGGGMQLLLVLDKVIAADDAYFSLPAAEEGIVPGVANFRLPKKIGSRLAREMIFSGQKMRATDAEASLFCDKVLPSLEIESAVETAILELDNPAVVENRRMLNLTEEPRDLLRQYMAEFAYIQSKRLYSSDFLENIGRWTSRVQENQVEHA